MNIIDWQQFGLKKNPYSTRPLVEGGDISIDKAFIGREKEKDYLNALLANEDNLALAVCGNVGVGKTSLVNFQKYVFKYDREKLLFSFRREIEASLDLLNKKNFIIEIIGATLREFRLLQPDLFKDNFVKSLEQLVDISHAISFSGSLSGGISGYSGGMGFNKGKTLTQPLQISTTVLEDYLRRLVDFIKNNEIKGLRYSGLIIHVNNFELVMAESTDRKKLVQFFMDIRDILQMNDIFYIFLGPPDFYKDVIAVNARVKSVFIEHPLKINPLSKSEIAAALDERLKLLKSDDINNFIKPIEDTVIFRLYDLYNGDIRRIMTSIKAIIGQCAEISSKPINTEEALVLLGQARLEQIEYNFKLSDEQKKVLYYIVNSERYVSQKEVAEFLNKDRGNISRYYFKPLIEHNVIEEKEKKNKTPYWGLTVEFEPLKWQLSAMRKVKENLKTVSMQPTLF